MLLLQQNCGKGYECTVAALEAGLGLEASIVCIQETFFWEIAALLMQGLTYTGHLELTTEGICEF